MLTNLHLSLSASPIHMFNPIPVSWQLVLLLSVVPNLLSRGWWWWLCCLLRWWREFSVLKPDGLGLGEWRPNVLHFGPRKPSRQGIQLYQARQCLGIYAKPNTALQITGIFFQGPERSFYNTAHTSDNSTLKLLSSGLWHHVVWYSSINLLE